MALDSRSITLEDDPLWYKNAVIYQLHVRAFHDSDGDGIGDFRGLTQKLDYLQDLGVTALWLLPFYPSPLRDDGYDIADYTNVHPAYGTLRDVKEFIAESHRRGLRVITELVLNHTSDQHAWFQRARKAKPGSSLREFYVWSDTDQKYDGTRVIFKDFESSNWAWDPLAHAYYWHRFYSHQPDLNFDNPRVHRALLRVLDFWFNMGIDGLRLDAVPYLYEREGTTCENLPETHEFLKKLRKHVDERHGNRMLLAEANQWPEDAISYFGPPDGDECQMAFHFPLMPRLFMGIRMEDRFPIIDILQQTPEIPENCQWAVFLRNHDELTLEMVTDEERDYMYRVYATDRQARINLGIRRRLAPLLGNNRRKTELMNGLLFSLGGTPVMYYGDEIGMGDNVYLGDRDGVRTPMQWSPDRNAGFSRANPQKLYLPVIIDPEYHFETVNVEAQQSNPHSMLWWIRRLIALRQRYPVFGTGAIEFLHPDNPKVLAFLRKPKPPLGSGAGHSEDLTVLIVANLSRFAQCVELDLSEFGGTKPMEMFGMTPFPAIGELPYFLTLGPHSFYWFALDRTPRATVAAGEEPPQVVSLPAAAPWTELFQGRRRRALEAALPKVLATRRWFGGKAKAVESAGILDVVPFGHNTDGRAACILLVQVAYHDAEAESYQLPIAFAEGEDALVIERDKPHSILFRLGDSGIVYDAVHSREFCEAILDAVVTRRRLRGERGQIRGNSSKRLRRRELVDGLDPVVSGADQSNTSIIYGDKLIVKLFRRVAAPGVSRSGGGGMNPDLEVGLFLTERVAFPHTPAIVGYIEHRGEKALRDEPSTLAVVQSFVVNEGDAWRYTLSSLSTYFERVLTEHPGRPPEPAGETGSTLLAEPPPIAYDVIGPYMQSAELIGRRTAELHLALAADPEDPAFGPERFSTHNQRSLYQSMRTLTRISMRTLRRRMSTLEGEALVLAERMLASEPELLDRFARILGSELGGQRIRTHGDYHLGQVLFTGRDFLIIDFEGEPGRPLSERRMKRSPLRDVAGMLRSFEYAAFTALADHRKRWGDPSDVEHERLDAWARFWLRWVTRTFLRSYLESVGESPIVPRHSEQRDLILEAFMLEKAVYELEYELNNRPQWVWLPLMGILKLLEQEPPA